MRQLLKGFVTLAGFPTFEPLKVRPVAGFWSRFSLAGTRNCVPIFRLSGRGSTQVAQLTRTRTFQGETTVEIVYLISILPSGPDAPQRLLELSRGQWSIENSLHDVRDITLAQDRSRLHAAHAPQLLAACRNLAITLIHRSGSSQIAAARRSFSYHPHRAFDLLLSRASPQQSFTGPEFNVCLQPHALHTD